MKPPTEIETAATENPVVGIDQTKGDFQYKVDHYAFDAGTGLSEDTVRYISSVKKEAPWILEFRLKAGWDKKIPAPCILLHQRAIHPADGNPCSEIIVANPGAKGGARTDLREGESYEVGNALNPFDFYVRITVLKIDVETMEAQLQINIRQARHFEPGATLFGGVANDGGGLIWVPGRGFVKVPPRSPLIAVLQSLAEYEALQSIDGGRQGHQLEGLRLERLTAMRDQLSAMIDARQERGVPAPVLTGRRGR